MRKRVLSFLLAAVLTLTLAPVAWAASFTDVPASHWAYSDIMTCADQGIVTGFADGSFRPGDEVTTAQFVAMLTRTFYSSDVAAAQGTGGTWYAPNAKVAGDHNLLGFWSNYAIEVDDQPIYRYLMAILLSNIMKDFGKSASDSERASAESQIADWNSIGAPYRKDVSNCYARGILTGMSDGQFHGFSNMNRAQACAAIVRMIHLIDGSTPAAPTQPTQPQQPEPPAETSTRKLANGKDVTEENVQEILDDLKRQYPSGTPWGPQGTANNHHYADGDKSLEISIVTIMIRASGSKGTTLDLRYACGGWMAMVSDRIFGQTGAPLRQVTEGSDLRIGDIIIHVSRSTGNISHVSIVDSVDGKGGFTTCDGNSGSTVQWGCPRPSLETGTTYTYTLAYTRYPE